MVAANDFVSEYVLFRPTAVKFGPWLGDVPLRPHDNYQEQSLKSETNKFVLR